MSSNPIRKLAAWATSMAAVASLLAVSHVDGGSGAVSEGLRVHEEWYRAVLGRSIGLGGLQVADLDGDGALEVLATAGSYWYVLSHEAGEYRVEWASPPFQGHVSNLLAVDLDGVPGLEILASHGQDVFIHDGATRRLLRTLRMGVPSLRDLQVADADGDGELEILFCSVAGLHVHDAATGQEEYLGRDYRCDGLAVGNVDGDPSPEIVLGYDDGFLAPGYVLDGATKQLQASSDDGFGRFVRTGDLDGDGRDEIVAAGHFSDVAIYEGGLGPPAWEIPVGAADLHALEVLDVEGDGSLEIVYGDGEAVAVHVWDGQARQPAWTIEPVVPGSHVSGLAVGDPDGDDVNEVLWGSSSPGLFVASTETLEIEWRSEGKDVAGPFPGLDFGDVDADGEPEILYAGENVTAHGLDGSSLLVHDARTKALERKSPIDRGEVRRLRHADVDGDPQAEVFVLTGPDDVVIAYDGLTHTEEWRWFPREFLYSLELADLEGDGDLELVAGGRGGRFYVVDAATGTEEWRNEGDGDGDVLFTSLRVANVDGDPGLEVVAAGGSDGRLFVFDGVTRELEAATEALDVSALALVNRDGDGAAEIVVGTRRGEVLGVDARTGAVTETLGDFGDLVYALRLADLTGDLVPELVLAQEHEVSVYDGRFPHELLWRSGRIGTAVGSGDSLRVADIDEDGKIEILVSLGEIGLRVYQVEGLGVDPPPGPYLETPELPGFRFKVRITAGGQEFAGTMEADCLAETLCVSGALAGRSELFLRIIGPRPNGYLWVNLVRFTPSRVEVWVEQLETGETRSYVLPEVPAGSDELPGRLDREAFAP